MSNREGTYGQLKRSPLVFLEGWVHRITQAVQLWLSDQHRVTRRFMVSAILVLALLAFELFNFDTTEYALEDLLGPTSFAGVRWATILAIAFCSIDFAGLARLIMPEERMMADGRMLKPAWLLLGAWLLGGGMKVTGDVTGEGEFRIEGCVEGSVSAAGRVIVESRGEVRGDIEAAEVVASGKVSGKITASGAVRLENGCQIEADVEAATISLEEGGIVNGTLKMNSLGE